MPCQNRVCETKDNHGILMKLGKIFPLSPFFRGLSLLDRYIASQLIAPFLFGVSAFSCIGVSLGSLLDLLSKVAESEIPFSTAMQILLLKVPEFASYALPISVLLAALITYSRLSNDSELIALRSCGISLYRLVAPVIVLSLLITGVTFLFNELVVPQANFRANLLLYEAIHQQKGNFQAQNILYPEYEEIIQPDGTEDQELKRLFYAHRFEGNRLRGLTVLDESEPGVKQLITCESALWNSEQNSWDFFNGIIYFYSPDASQSHVLRFAEKRLKLPKLGLISATERNDPYEMNITQALHYQELLKFSSNQAKFKMFQVRIQQKIAFPFICLIFGLLGAALGTRPQDNSRSTSFGICVLVTFGYYLLIFMLGGLGIAGLISPIMAAWLPNLLGLGMGGWLLNQSE